MKGVRVKCAKWRFYRTPFLFYLDFHLGHKVTLLPSTSLQELKTADFTNILTVRFPSEQLAKFSEKLSMILNSLCWRQVIQITNIVLLSMHTKPTKIHNAALFDDINLELRMTINMRKTMMLLIMMKMTSSILMMLLSIMMKRVSS